MNTFRLALGFAVASLLALAGCSKTEGTPGKPGEPAASSATTKKVDMAQAKEIFNTRCAACHGTEGKGDGPGAAALTPKPRNYTDKEWQKSVTDDQIRKTITLGGAAVGKSPIMPASPDLESKPEVVDGLVQMVRSFSK